MWGRCRCGGGGGGGFCCGNTLAALFRSLDETLLVAQEGILVVTSSVESEQVEPALLPNDSATSIVYFHGCN
eukprot:m.1196965 g.1196965  ORF g.1196965 m.1196965 type:complete len:72 (-) comp24564_c0_seq2:1424-1639(-)